MAKIKGKIKLENIESENISNYLENYCWKITTPWVVTVAIVDVVLLVVAAILFYEFEIPKLICIITSVGVISVLIYFLDKVVKNEINCTFYMGIFASLLSVCAALLPYAIMNYEESEDYLICFLMIISICVIRAIIVWIMHKKRIAKNHYIESKSNLFRARFVILYGYLVILLLKSGSFWGFFGSLAICAAENVFFFIRVHCYKLLENRNE